jgi:hypothetical protein
MYKILYLFVGSNYPVKQFYEEISTTTGGQKLDLNNFQHIIDLIYAICFKEGGGQPHLEQYARELEQNNRLQGALQEQILNMLQIPDGMYAFEKVPADMELRQAI